MTDLKYRPPRLFRLMLRNLVIFEELFAITRDFDIEYDSVRQDSGRIRAFLWLLWSTIQVGSYYLVLTTKWSIVMVGNHLKIAVRNIRKHKGFAFINITGLAVGMASCLLMLMFVINEYSFDNFHENKDRIYRVVVDWGKEGSRTRYAGSMPGITPVLNEEVPEVEYAARVRPAFRALLVNRQDKEFKEENAFYADNEVFRIFSWNLTSGDMKTALIEPFSVILSTRMAQKYFANENPMGSEITIDDLPYKVTGVMEDLPPNTHLNCEILISYKTIIAQGEYPDAPWNVWGDDFNYCLLKENASSSGLKEKLKGLLEKNSGQWIAEKMVLIPQRLSNIHWDVESRGDVGDKGNSLYMKIFLTAAVLVLLIACFNFMNLSTSRYSDRMKEVGIRKVVGANRGQLINQFLLESFLVSAIAVALGLFLFEILKGAFYSFLSTGVFVSTSDFTRVLYVVIGLLMSVGLFGGLYPAVFLSRFRPVDVFKSGVFGVKSKLVFRRVLVIIQYSISLVLILGTIVIFQQLSYMKNSDLGFEKEDVVLLRFPFGNEEAQSKYPVLRDDILNIANVVDVSGAYTVPGVNSQFQMTVRRVGADQDDYTTFQALPADYGYVKSMRLELVEGRDFSKEFALDAQENIILNETGVKLLALNKPIGQRLVIPRAGKTAEMTVVGVVKDFHVKSLHNKISPMLIFIGPEMFSTMVIKLKPDNHEGVLGQIRDSWSRILPNAGFNYRYLEDAYHSLYTTEEQTGRLILIFTGLALFVSCLGLFGLASFAAAKRIKEIGIRKVMGASVRGIFLLVSLQFMRWVVLSNVFAWPIAYLLLNSWLDNFAYRIELGILPFVLSGMAALLIALMTVGFQSIKAAVSNPVDSLRYE
ncbi:ABC transporter permease [Acidobacteriota bacterium]